jgi:adenylyltransferase/sulfurtransferase
VIGSLQALEVVKLILGIGDSLVGRLVLFDALALRFRELALNKDPACVVCGASATVRAPVDYEAFCGLRGEEARPDSRGMPLLSVEAFASQRQQGAAAELLDVREAHEHAIVHIPEARSMPLGELPARLHELDSARPYVIACHRGLRSIEAYYLLHKAGFRRLAILDGGVDAWAERVDPTMPRY